jgi:gas vesicle protein GvpN
MIHDTSSCGEPVTTLSLRPRGDYVNTPTVQAIAKRALSYLDAGFALHLRGPAGSGKTTLAFRLAAERGRPTMFLVGDECMTTADLIGKQTRFQHRKVVDRFIHSVMKYEENVEQHWTDAKLTVACREGFTLIYDEFTRSRPEANNVLLGVLEERMLALPVDNGVGEYLKVHPDFRIIFTSNPREYAGVHASQDALNDRLITMDMDYVDEATEIAIVASRTKLPLALATPIVRLVRAYRASGEYEQSPTPRATIMIARMVVAQKLKPDADSKEFVQLCLDVLEGKCMRSGHASDCAPKHRRTLLNLIDKHCKAPRQANGKARPMTPRKGAPRGGAARAPARRPVLVHAGGLNS